MKMEGLNSEPKSHVTLWNVQTMFEAGKLEQVANKLTRCKLHLGDE